MKWSALSLCGFIFFLTSALAEDPASRQGPPFPKDHWLHGVDFSSYRQEALRRGVEIPERSDDLDLHLVEKFQKIFSTHVDSRFLLGRPSPKWVMERSLEVLDLNRRLEKKLSQGRRVLAEGNKREMRRYLDDVKDLSGDLKKLFETRFREGPKTRLTMRLPVLESEDPRRVFSAFLAVAKELSRILTQRITAFFFIDERNVVSVTDLNKPSVTVLCRSLRKLCEESDKLIRRF
ncbi:MAG TPA: hypothetical protein VLV83_01335 [Acidobacteriota bacterium]|nr:hypothetical protein [Acidobacteriota bacterium]